MVPVQGNANAHEVDWAVFLNAGVGGSYALAEVFRFVQGGGVLVTPSDFCKKDAAAVPAGLAGNRWYKTATGVIRIVV